MLLRQRKLRLTAYVAIAAVVTCAGFVAQATNLLRPLELTSVDARFHVRGRQPQPRDVAVVAIDATTQHALGLTTSTQVGQRYPYQRRLYAHVIDRLKADGATVIAYDIQFTEQTNRTDDYALFKAIQANPPVVLSATEVTKNGATNVFGGDSVVKAAHARAGNTTLNADGKGVNRTVPRAIAGLKSFAVVANEMATGEAIGNRGFGLPKHQAWIDYVGPPGSILTVPFSDVLAGHFKRGTFRGRIVVVGATAVALQDIHATSTTTGDALMSGPELQANAIETVRRGLPLQSIAGWLSWVLVALMASLLPLVALRIRFLFATLVALAAAAAYVVAAQVLFDAGWIVPVAVPLSALALAALTTSANHALLSAAERMRTRELFARFVPEAVVDDVLARTDSDLRLGGQRREGTIMFCDLRGFTTFSENLPPDRVINVINQYFTEMTAAIMERQGTLIAYLGDGILAVFGAPLEQVDHADRALDAARDMLFTRLPRFNAALAEQGIDHQFRLGIGLNSGDVVSGNVGSPQRIEYAAIGDTTNTAARVEAMTKVEGEQLLFTSATKDALQRESSARGLRAIGEREVRGRKNTITLWSFDDVDAVSGGPTATPPR